MPTPDAAPASPTIPSVLLVDDEPAVLDGLRRHLRDGYRIVSATSGQDGLAALEAEGPFAVIVSDMRMPGMDGAAFLTQSRTRWPDTTRVLLTGHSDIGAAMAAVNGGQIFRFLLKPCDVGTFKRTLADAIAQHRLVVAERELLEQTLHGSVRALVETLSLANPVAFARAVRIRAIIGRLLDAVPVEPRWEVEVAAMLSQLGAVTLPEPTAERLNEGRPLSADEQAMVDRLPDLAERLLAPIPRLEGVRALIRGQVNGGSGRSLPTGAQVLRTAVAFDALVARGLDEVEAVSVLKRDASRQGIDPGVVSALEAMASTAAQPSSVVEVKLSQLRPGMRLEADLRTADGLLLVGRGQPVTDRVLARIENFASQTDLSPTVLVSTGDDGDSAT